MIADVTGTPVEVPEGTEFGAKGAALLAATAIGWFSDIRQAAVATYRASRRHEPDPILRDAYDAGFKRYTVASEAMLEGIAPAYRKPAPA
jgi:sugar (pentulose or hexulose) kinase